MEYYVYEYRNPKTKVPFYVGKGRNNRYKQHLTRPSREMANELSRLRELGLEPEIEVVLYTDVEAVALSVEEHLISFYGLRKYGGTLINKMKKSGSNTRVDIPQDVVCKLGTMPDRALGELTGINWSTLRDCRNSLGIRSFRERYKNTEKLSSVFKKDTNVYTIYDTNGNSLTGTRYALLEKTSMSTSKLGLLLSGKAKHVKGWFLNRPDPSVVTEYSIRTLYHDAEGVFKGTYKEFSEKYGYRIQSCRNLYTGKSKTLYGWHLTS